MMVRLPLGLRLIAALLLVTPWAAPAAAPRRAHHAIDWTKMAVMTPEGGIRIGNPAAKARLVEYGSFTCPHCAAFAQEAFPLIRDRYVRTGALSFEFRAALRDGADLLAATTVWCGGPAGFVDTAVAVFKAQQNWVDAAAAWAGAHQGALQDPKGDTLPQLAAASGLSAIAAAHGIPAARLDQCLADTKLRDRLAAAAGEAWNTRRIAGTPAFFLNDEQLDNVFGWAALEPQIRARVRG
ncbi:thioredoxin domain-containing protein [Sphingomonas morindae]|uniref:DsbA family protein n=1 Tax=Sphingomonas morindae TaxID=1541170 RepID=A0ABY4X562_9SPHN|nr:thioredoxin domain-containing protein [Sphingomonas morindae]USI72044.1 DsbA family protein [Sphingomonas morindae]